MNRSSKFGLATVAALAGLFVLAGAASAHVTVTAPGATSGGSDQEITFRVPVEKTIDTVGLTIQLPTTTPIASVLVEPIPGWTHTQKTITLAKPIITDDGDITQAVSQISWTAETGHGLVPGEFGEFTIIAGQLPTTSQLVFPAIQTYSDGSVVSWNQVAAPGSTVEPDNPAPILLLGAAPGGGTAKPVATSTSTTKSSDTAALVLAIVALVIALAALGLAVVSRVRRADGGT